MDRSRLEAFPILSGLGPDDLDAIASVASELEVEAGRELTAQGDFGHALVAIERGTADVSRDGEVLRVLGPGDIFGEGCGARLGPADGDGRRDRVDDADRGLQARRVGARAAIA